MFKITIIRSFFLLLFISLDLAAVTIDDVAKRKKTVISVMKKYKYHTHPAVNSAYLKYKRTEAMYELQQRKVKIPGAFIKWIDKTPTVKLAVYGTRENVADVIETLWALQLGLGGKRFQQNQQLVLAGALFNSHLKEKANNLRKMVRLKPSIQLLKDPRKPVNTRTRKRKLDMNDHIINFLNSRKIKSDHNALKLGLFTELKYDTRGIAISNKSSSTSKGSKERNLYASDVMADRYLQDEFNKYMTSKGFPKARINCGNRLVFWKSSEMIGEERGDIHKAYELFKTAYEEKGLLPKTRPLPTLSEWLAYLIRNNAVKDVKNGNWPLFPLNAPWPVLRLLTFNYQMQTLRECEERWVAYRKKGEKRCYGEYIGMIAQQYDMQSARRLSPYPFTYGSIQIIMKDGGVCGLMARMGTLTQLTLGIPAVQAGQPGHCALIVYGYDKKQNTYNCNIQQSVTAGPLGTWPHANYNFADNNRRMGMIYDQATAYGVNYGVTNFNSSLIAYNAFRLLSDEEQKKFAIRYLGGAMGINPYNLLVIDKAIGLIDDPKVLVYLGMEFTKSFESIKKLGCPKTGLYQKAVRDRIVARIGGLDVPKQVKAIRYIYTYLKSAPCDDVVFMKYRLKIENPKDVLKQVVVEFKTYVKTVWTLPLKEGDPKAESLSLSLAAFSLQIKDKKSRKSWANGMLKLMYGKEMYFNEKNDLIVNPVYTALIKAAEVTQPTSEQLLLNSLTQLYKEIKFACAKSRKFTIQQFTMYSLNMMGVVQTHGENPQTIKWLKSMKSLLNNHKKITASSGSVVANPCYAKLLELLNPKK